MKRILVIIGFIVVLIVSGCSTVVENQDEIKESKLNGSFDSDQMYDYVSLLEEELQGGIRVSVNPTIEAAYLVIEMASPVEGYSQYKHSTYMSNQVTHFKKYEDHEVFKIVVPMFQSGFNFDTVPSVLHYFDKDGNLKEGIQLDSDILGKAGGLDAVQTFIDALFDFRKESNYDTYFKSNEAYYREQMGKAIVLLEETDLVRIVEKHYGYLIGDINITVTPDSTGGYGCRNVYDDRVELLPTLSALEDSQSFAIFLIHELSHPYVNPETAKYPEIVSKSEEIYKVIDEQMRRQAYSDWETALNEHIVRANTAIIIGDIYGEEYKAAILKDEASKGFIYVDEIAEYIDVYTENRQSDECFDEYVEGLLVMVSEIMK